MTAHRFARCSFLFAAMLAAATSAQASVEISSKPTHNMTCSGGICSPTAKKAVLNVTELESMLAIGDVTIVSGDQAKDIEINVALSWTSTQRLTLDAYHTLTVNNPISVRGPGGLSIKIEEGLVNGDYFFTGRGRVIFRDPAGSLTIGSETYVLVDSIAALVAAVEANGEARIALTDNYDASVDGVYTKAPVFDHAGYFDGLGNAIDNFTIKDVNGTENHCLGLFSFGGIMRNIAMHNAVVMQIDPQPSQHDAGAILSCTGYGIAHAVVSGIVSLQSLDAAGGGIAAGNIGVIRQSSADVSVSAHFAGALVGTNSGLIDQSSATGTVTATFGSYDARLGGLVGFNDQGTVTRSLAKVDIAQQTVDRAIIGGLAGVSWYGSISQSYATGSISGHNRTHIGGLVGLNDHGSIVQSYATGPAAGGDRKSLVGGLVGANTVRGKISQSYSTGAVSVGDAGEAGGLLGKDHANAGKITTAYWNLDTSGISDPSRGAGNPANDPGITGLTDAQLKSGLPPGFDPAIWTQNVNINNGYPYLLANPPQ